MGVMKEDSEKYLDIRVCPYTQGGTVRNAVIHYKIRQQDGSFQEMTVRDTPSISFVSVAFAMRIRAP